MDRQRHFFQTAQILKVLGLIAFLLSDLPTLAQVNEKILKSQWNAFWISVPNEPPHDYGVYNFRKQFSLRQKPESFVIHVSADNRYKLYVNGNLVSLGPARGDLYHWNFETVDLAPYLVQGQNNISAVVWNFGSRRPEAQISWQTAFILQGNSVNEKAVNTDRTWKCTRDESYEPLEPQLLYTYYVSGPGEKRDFNKAIDGWTLHEFDDAGWKNAREHFKGLPKGVFAWTNGWMLVPRTIPLMELSPQQLMTVRDSEGISLPKNFPQVKTKIHVPANSKVRMLLDQSHLTNAYPVVQFSGGKSSAIKLSYAEALYIKEPGTDWRAQNKKGNRNEVEGKRFVGVSDHIISSGKPNQFFSPLWWRTYRYLQLEIETKAEPLVIDDVYGMFTGYPFKFNASFESTNAELNKILDVGWRTARLCAAETYMDCPYYEQLQYIGDTRIQALVSYYNSGDDRLVRNALNLMDQSRMAEGITLSRHPSFNPQQIPTFSLWYIEMLRDFWMYRPDAHFVKGKLQSVRSVLAFFEKYQREDGLVKNAPYWEFTDWCEREGWHAGVAPVGSNGTSAPVDLLLCLAYRTAAELEQNLGIQGYAQHYQEKYRQLKGSVLNTYWDESKQCFSDTNDKQYFSQHTNTLAILADVVVGEQAKSLMEKVVKDTTLSQATIYFKYYVHHAMNKCGMGDRYLDMLSDWQTQLNNGLTTWAEISEHTAARSDCHAWGASPNVELFRIVLGVDSDGPGFSKIKIEPHLGKLDEVKGSVPHPDGIISVDISVKKGQRKAMVTLPEKTEGRFLWQGKEYPLASGANTVSF